ncbi:MAG: hypothetical protein ACFFCF_03225 [Promethearchaeota archaeon]
MDGNPDNILKKSQRYTRILVASGILIIFFGVIFWVIGIIQKQILETVHPGLIIDVFPPIGILIIGLVICIIGISIRNSELP